MTRTRVIVAVVGGEFAPTLSHDLGAEIARQGQILLTGGEIKPGSKATKDCAMVGAASIAAASQSTARLIGVLRDDYRFSWKCSIASTIRALFIQVGPLGESRNVINGRTADVCLALKGGPGTLSELTYAALGDIPVLLVDSAQHLQGRLERPEYNAQLAAARDWYRELPDVETCKTAARAALDRSDRWIPGPDLVDTERIIRCAVDLARASGMHGHFPGIPGQPEFATAFQQCLSQVDR